VVGPARAVVLRLLGRLIEELLIAPAEHDGVGARRAEPFGQGSRDVGAAAEDDDALGLAEVIFHGRVFQSV